MPYWRLSSIYFSYFAVVGALMPFWGLYLQQELGFDARQISALVAIPLVTKMIGPNIWGWLADRSEQPVMIIRWGALGACLFFAALMVRRDYESLFFFIALYSLFWNAILPQFEVITLSFLKSKPYAYGKIRLWGSVGFIFAVTGLGVYFDSYSLVYLPVVICFLLFMILVSVCFIPNVPSNKTLKGRGNFIALLVKPRVLMFFFVCFLLQLSHGVYYVFYSIYLEGYEYSRTSIAVFWSVGVIAEIVIFLKMPALFGRFSIFQLLTASLFLTMVRWLGMGLFPEQQIILIGLQLLHAFSFGVTHAVAIEVIRRTFGHTSQNQGQAFYSAFSFGGGTALGAYLSGSLWAIHNNYAFMFMSIPVLISFVLTLIFLRRFLSTDGTV